MIQPSPGPFYTVLILYLGIMAFIGWYAGRGTKNLGDFFVLSGKAGVIVSGIAYFSTQFSMGTFLGTPGTIYGVGYAGMAISVPGAVFCMILPAILIGRKLVTLGHEYGFLTMADYLSDPVSMETVPVYEITSYGSSMAPYYIMLALFVGSLLTATMLHVNAPMPGLFRLRPWQRFFGRYQLFFLIGMIQALVTGLGCIYYIGIQCPYPGLFLLACCVCSLNFTMMNYALVYALDNIGMAASVIIMVIQVAGSGGVYPIDVLPGIFQSLYKFMPFHYGMDMLRETIAGRYENVYWKNLAVMAAMCVLFAVLGMVLYYPARPLNRLIARSKEKSGIM